MNFKRVMMTLLTATLLPSLVFAQAAPPPVTSTNFTVNKYFDDGNSATDVTVHIQCFTGLPLNQQQTVNPDNSGSFEVNFIVESFEQDQLDCNIWEEDVAGYTASYSADTDVAGSATDDSDGCHFENIGNSNYPSEDDDNQCDITNYPDPVEVTVTKDWEVDGSGGNALDPTYSLTLWCDNEIEDGSSCESKNGGYYDSCYYYGSGTWYKELTEYGTGDTDDEDYTAHVVPDWDGGTDCWVEEEVWDSSVEVDNGCAEPLVAKSSEESPYPLNVEIGDADDANACTIVNTVFYEGIPTLSQYGMAIMALLMLGVGFVGFRRFV